MDYKQKYYKYKAKYLNEKQKGAGFFNCNIEDDKANVIKFDYETNEPEQSFTNDHLNYMKSMPSYVFQLTIEDSSSVIRDHSSKDIILREDTTYDTIKNEIRAFAKLESGNKAKVTIKNIWIPVVKNPVNLRNFLTTILQNKDILISEVHAMAPMTHVYLKSIPKIPEFATLHQYIWIMNPETGEYMTMGLNGFGPEINAWQASLEGDSIVLPEKNNWEKMNSGLFVQFPDFAVNICSDATRECYGRHRMIEGNDNNMYAVGTIVREFSITSEQVPWLNKVADNLFWLAIGGDINEIDKIDNIGENENYPTIVLASNIYERDFSPIAHLVPELITWAKKCVYGEEESPKSINCRSFAGDFSRGKVPN
jgi:hypothetical protein